MPVISREQDYINGEQFIRSIRVLKDGLFRITCPPCMGDKLGFYEITHETRAGCVKAFMEAKEKYINSRTTSKKVILYKFKMSGFIMGPAKLSDEFIPGEDDPELMICLFRGEDFSFDKGMIVGVKARVYIEERNEREDGEIYWTYNKVDDDDDLPLGIRDDCRPKGRYGDKASNQNCIEWTPERHAFFVSLHEAMSQLILKIRHLADPEKLAIAMKKQTLISWALKEE